MPACVLKEIPVNMHAAQNVVWEVRLPVITLADIFRGINEGSMYDLLSIQTTDVKSCCSQAGSVQLPWTMTNVN